MDLSNYELKTLDLDISPQKCLTHFLSVKTPNFGQVYLEITNTFCLGDATISFGFRNDFPTH